MRKILLVSWIMAALVIGTIPAFAAGRVALVIGNNVYQNVPVLPNPVNDATDLSVSLVRLGFTVRTLTNTKYDDMRRALVEFGEQARGADIALIFFAGHGIQIGGENWLIPVDARLSTDLNVANETIGLQSLIRAVSNTAKLGLVILDACRNNPFLAKMQTTNVSRAVERGFSRVEPSENILVAYSARDGSTATDGSGRNSPFTQSLLKNIETPGLEITFLFRRVRDDVMRVTKREQQPFVYGTLSTDAIYLKPPVPAAEPVTGDMLLWETIRESKLPALFEEFLKKYPNSARAAAARARLAELVGQRVDKPDVASNVAALSVAKPGSSAEAIATGASMSGTPFVAEQVPFICDKCRNELRKEMSKPRKHSAVTVSLDGGYFTSNGASTADEARGWALGRCLEARRFVCMVYAVDGKIFWDEPRPSVPPKPLIRALSESPLDFQQIAGVSTRDQTRLAELKKSKPKMALAVGTLSQWAMASDGATDDENARMALERCAYLTRSLCQVVAVNDTLLVPRGQEIAFSPARSFAFQKRTPQAFDPGQIPIVSEEGRARIRNAWADRRQHGALVISYEGGYWWSLNRGTAEEARTLALGQCMAATQMMCMLYAVDNETVWNEPQPVLPAKPWFVRDPKTEKPLNIDKAMARFPPTSKQSVRDNYMPAADPKAIAVMPHHWSMSYSRIGQIKSEEEAARMALERCGFLGRRPCRVVAVSNNAVGAGGPAR